MKVCVISSPVFAVGSQGLSGYGGLEQIAWQSAKGLAELGHEVSLVAPDGSSCPGAEVIECGPSGRISEHDAYQKYWQRLPDFDVVIDHSWAKFSYLLKGEGVLKCPVLGVMHAPVATMYQTLPPNVDNPCFVCISQDQAKVFDAIHGRDAKVCYNGIDLSFYRSLGIPRTKRFLFLARFSTVKSPDIAIEACKAAGVGLDLVGDTSITNEPEYLEKCIRVCDGEQIRMVGPATRGETVYWYSQAHALIHPTKNFREPFGLAPVEAMACGCPVIAWNYGAVKETVKGAGSLVTNFDGLVQGIKEFANPVTDHYRTSCRQRAEQFSEQRMVRRYEELCMEAVTTGGW